MFGVIDVYVKLFDLIGGLLDLIFIYDGVVICGKKVNGSGMFEVLIGVGLIFVLVMVFVCYFVI